MADDHEMLLHQAVIHDKQDLVRDVLRYLSPNSLDRLGRSPLFDAAYQGHLAVLKILLQAGGDPGLIDHDGLSVLHQAAKGGHVECIRLLLEYGADPTYCNREGKNAVELAADEGHHVCAKLLKEALRLKQYCDSGQLHELKAALQKDPSLINQSCEVTGGLTFFSWLCEQCLRGHRFIDSSVLRSVLIQRKVSLSPSLLGNDLPLHRLCRAGSPHLVSLLLEYTSPEDDMTNAQGETPLHVAVQHENVDVVHLLSADLIDPHVSEHPSGGADGRAAQSDACVPRPWHGAVLAWHSVQDRAGCLPLHIAAAKPNISMLKFLLSAHDSITNINAVSAHGFTPLHEAALVGSDEKVKLLLAAGARPDQCTKLELTCVSYDVRIVFADCPNLPALPWALAAAAGWFGVAKRLFVKSSLKRCLVQAVAQKEEYAELCGFLVTHLGVDECGEPGGPVSRTVSWQDLGLRQVVPCWLDNVQRLEQTPGVGVQSAAITELNLSGNSIQRLPCEVLKLKHVESLIMAKNSLIELPDISGVDGGNLSFMAWPKLRRLDVSHNKLTFLPDYVFFLPNLCHLLVSHNRLKQLPAHLWLAPKLAKVIAQYNQITSIALPEVSAIRNEGEQELLMGPSLSLLESYSYLSATPSLIGSHRLQRRQDQVSAVADDIVVAETLQWQANEGLESWRQHCYAEREDHPGYGVRSKYFLEDRLANEDDDEDDALNSSLSLDGLQSPSLHLRSQLTMLDLTGNQLTQLPPGLPCLAPRLENLILAKNNLRDFGCVSSYPASVAQLNLSDNQALQSVQPASMGHNPPMQCYCLMSVQSTSSLSIRQRCRRQNHRQLPVLETLNLSGNRLSVIHVLDTTPPTHSLHNPAGGTQADTSESADGEDVAFLEQRSLLFPNLQCLDLQRNCLAVFPLEICFLHSLQRLRLDNNPIHRLPNQLGRLSAKVLYELGLGGLQLNDPPPDIVQQGVRGILPFLAGRLRKAYKYRHMKLMLVGLADQGKSTLLRQLCGEAINQADNLSTVGIDLGTWKCHKPVGFFNAPAIDPIDFSTWDFAGQEDYYATHLCFLSRRSLYLLVWKLSSSLDEAKKSMEAWLRNIQARAPGSTVILVGTHLDRFDGGLSKCQQFVYPHLKRHFAVGNPNRQEELGYPRITGIAFVNSLTGEGIDGLSGLRNTIFETANTLPDHTGARGQMYLLNQEVPSTYIALQQRVEELRKKISTEHKQPPVLSATEFRARVKDIIEDVQELNVAVSFLHDNGVILHYNDPNLHHLYFIDPQWLCKMLAKVVTVRQVTPGIKEDGILPRSELPVIFKGSNFPQKYFDDCIQLLAKFEVSLAVDDDRFLVPSRLSEEPPGDDFIVSSPWQQGGHRLRRLYVMVYMPSGLWPRLITRLMSGDVKATAAEYGLDQDWDGHQEKDVLGWHPWRTGIQLRLFGAPLVIVREVSGDNIFEERFDDGSIEMHDVSVLDTNTWRRFKLLPGARCIEILVARLARKERATSSAVEPTGAVTAEQSASITTESQRRREDDEEFEDEIDYYKESDEEPEDGEEVEEPVKDKHMFFGEAEQNAHEAHAAEVKRREQLLNQLPARLLALVVDTIDSLLNDWYPGVGERGSHLMSGTAYITRALLCPLCDDQLLPKHTGNPLDLLGHSPSDAPSIMQYAQNRQRLKHFAIKAPLDLKGSLCIYLLEQCILSACANWPSMYCHHHVQGIPIASMAPDALFVDLGSDMLIPGENVYQEELVGAGAFGDVYRAQLTLPGSSEELVAMKCFDRGSGSSGTAVSIGSVHQATRNYMALRQEVGLLGLLHHENVLVLRGVTLRPLSMLVAWAPLGSLDKLLDTLCQHLPPAKPQGLPPTVVLQLVQQVSAGLEFAHNLRITYRDLKSANILVWQFPSVEELLGVCAAGESDLAFLPVTVKLADFGIGRRAARGGIKGCQGTVGFMAPEIISFGGMEAYTEQVDIFSFGMFMYEIMGLQHPYPELGRVHVESLVQREIMPLLTKCVLNQPVSLVYLMHQCWQKEATQRPTASELYAAASSPTILSLIDATGLCVSGDVMAVCFAPGCEIPTLTPGSLRRRRSEDHLWLSVMTDTLTSVILVVTYEGTGTELKMVSLQLDKNMHVQCICAVGEYVFLFGRHGNVMVISNLTLRLVHQWSLPWSNSSWGDQSLPLVHVQCVQYVHNGNVLAITFSNGLLVLYPASLTQLKACTSESSDRWPKSVCLRSTFSVAAVPSSTQSGSTELWCGHASGLVTILDSHTLEEVTLLCLPSHSQQLLTVMHLCVQQDISASDPSAVHVWVATYPGTGLYCWDAVQRKCTHQIDCSAILQGSFVHVTHLTSARSHLVVSLSTGQVLLIDETGGITNCLDLHRSRLYQALLFPVSDTVTASTLHSAQMSAAHSRHHGNATQWLPPYMYMRRQPTQLSQPRQQSRLLLLTVGEELDISRCCRPAPPSGIDHQPAGVSDSSLWLALWNVDRFLTSSH